MENTIINLMLTNACNLKCYYCYQPRKMREDAHILPTVALDAVKYISDNFKEDTVIMFYGGEPLIKFDIIKMILNKYPHLIYKMLTNGILLSQEMYDFFLKYKDQIKIVWSAEAIQSEKKNNKPLSEFEDKIKLMLKLMKELKIGVHLVVSSPDALVSDFLFLIEKGANLFKISIPRKYEMSDVELSVYTKNMKQIIDLVCMKEVENIKFMIWDQLCSDYLRYSNPLFHSKPYFCGAGDHTFTITINGDIYPCDWFYALDKYRFGSIYDKIELKDSIFSTFAKDPGMLSFYCTSCPILHICSRGMCLAENLELNDDILKPTKYWCKVNILEVEIMQYMFSKIKREEIYAEQGVC